jgi:hypothetical protein
MSHLIRVTRTFLNEAAKPESFLGGSVVKCLLESGECVVRLTESTGIVGVVIEKAATKNEPITLEMGDTVRIKRPNGSFVTGILIESQFEKDTISDVEGDVVGQVGEFTLKFEGTGAPDGDLLR